MIEQITERPDKRACETHDRTPDPHGGARPRIKPHPGGHIYLELLIVFGIQMTKARFVADRMLPDIDADEARSRQKGDPNSLNECTASGKPAEAIEVDPGSKTSRRNSNGEPQHKAGVSKKPHYNTFIAIHMSLSLLYAMLSDPVTAAVTAICGPIAPSSVERNEQAIEKELPGRPLRSSRSRSCSSALKE